MDGIGPRLREARVSMQLTLREVEEQSGRLAEQWGNPAYKISLSWLSRVEQGNGDLSATKLIVLAFIYGLTNEQMLALCPTAIATSPLLNHPVGPNSTVLLGEGPLEEHAKLWLPFSVLTEPPPENTELMSNEQGPLPGRYRRGMIGKGDRAMHPMMQAGSIVLIDTYKRAIANRKQWNHEFDRPVYFLLARSGYFCGFCELDKEGDWLTVVPHPLSPESSKRWRYRKEIEVIGTIAAYFTRRPA